MNEKLNRLEKWKNGGESPPYLLDISSTNRCNLNCRSCWQRAPRFEDMEYSDEMKDETIKKVVEEALEMDVRRFEITGGGEPMVRKDLTLEIMERIKDGGKEGNITTNGTLFEEKDLDRLMEIGWDSITFSMDGSDRKNNDFLRGKGSFKSIVSSLRYLSENLSDGDRPKRKINTVISKENYDRLEEMIKLANRLNVAIVSFETLTVHSPKGKKLKIEKRDREKLPSSMRSAENASEKYGVETNISSLRKEYFEKSNEMDKVLERKGGEKFSEVACYEPWYHMVVKVDGSVQPCCLYDVKEENVKERTLKEIWYGDFFEKVRKKIRNKNFSKYCKICNASQVTANDEIREKLGG